MAPRRGTRARLSATEVFQREYPRDASSASAPRKSRASEIQLEGDWHRPLGARSGLALETVAAGRFDPRRVLRDDERHPLGGAATLRGHDEDAFRVDRYALSRLEWRYFLGRDGQRASLFYDQAWFQSRRLPTPGRARLEQGSAAGIGFGLRLPAAGGLVDVDYGLEPGRGFLDGRIHLQLVTTF